MKTIIYPDDLKINDYIGITATSSGISNNYDKERLEKAKFSLAKRGYKITETDNVMKNNMFVSSSPKTRAKEFLSLWQNDKIKVIAQLRGGEFLMEMLPYLDDNILKNTKPKWLTGYSDSSLLNFFITTKYNIATLTSPNVLQFSLEEVHESLIDKSNILEGKNNIQESFSKYEGKNVKEKIRYNLNKKVKYKSLYADQKTIIKGRMLGGCIEAISEVIGTRYDYVEDFINNFSEGILWYIDIFDSNPISLYRLLWQMKENNWFKNTTGVIIGRTRAKKKIGDFSYLDALHKIFDNLNIPVIYDIDLGHVMPSFSIINGSLGTFCYENGKGYLKQEKI